MSKAAAAGSGAKSSRDKTKHRDDDADAPDNAPPPEPGGYLDRSYSPLTSLIFVAPMVLFYELSLGWGGGSAGAEAPPSLVAFSLLRKFFNFFGATGQLLPSGTLIGLLLTWHLLRTERWRFRLTDLAGMVVESVLLAVPLVALGTLLSYLLPRIMLAGVSGLTTPQTAALCVGAGLYEELIFRLMILTFVSLLAGERKRSGVLAVLVSAVLFSAYHYLGAEPFHPRTFTFRTLAGIYFGALFLFRGFGVTAGSHAAYDLVVVFGLL